MTILASKIVNDVEDILSDSANSQWTAVRLLKWLNVTQRYIASLKPDVCVTTSSTILVAGVIQSVPTGGTGLIRLNWNLGTGGATVGAPITFIEKDVLDRTTPGWNVETANATVIHYMWDERDPTKFMVYPQQPTVAPGYVSITYSYVPADIAAIGNAITLDDIYEPHLIAGTCYYAFSEDAAHSVYAQERAQHYRDELFRLLGMKDPIEKENSPRPIRMSTDLTEG